ncbi:hypothetical protein KIN20_011501 [Parelaphostrongylus tenuis]|uniref:Uncharacterized protein n=1 Tax=Parelaphostrongylus tenuis TaxID=148309 RepID=A0AAD5MV34_PARTN|nr:hypothetical protein KIN20_011501 [Parelaphostrongylus tenuis]
MRSIVAASTRTFTVTGFTTLPDAMVFHVLERQARSTLLPDAVISTILGEFNVTINYKSLNCQMSVRPEEMLDKMKVSCIIVGNTVTGICTTGDKNLGMCTAAVNTNKNQVTITAVPDAYLTISITLST